MRSPPKCKCPVGEGAYRVRAGVSAVDAVDNARRIDRVMGVSSERGDGPARRTKRQIRHVTTREITTQAVRLGRRGLRPMRGWSAGQLARPCWFELDAPAALVDCW